jgi:DNA-binding response OmpR family regulator
VSEAKMKKILFIEDEITLQETIKETLKKEGYEVIKALDGETGLKLARENKPDLILLDLIIPKIHGLDVLETLKKDAATKEIPVIILSNLEGMEEIDKAVSLGATTYLVKTRYTLFELMEKVRKAIK